ncbi:hypothetical protein [Erythrobacter sp. THAF29]|uniref:hypothetical protein n=1 Tax=Erythrobacter sp. THAF29 TaxID=2587851 RepID=UPI001268C1D0|nr:hypothetical protein [Erythrobacter sp. THAF29]QFT75918.1 hypothetical protein FIU90_00045 [Erythrobacter sp. THAF29]
MNRIAPILAGLAAIAALPSCAPVEGAGQADAALAGPPVKVVGEAQTCINRNQIRNSRVRSDQVIDFEMRGGKVYRSTLPNRCPRLGFEEAFTYKTSINQLCSTDIIYVLEDIGGEIRRGAGCGLGKFVPVEYLDEDEDE